MGDSIMKPRIKFYTNGKPVDNYCRVLFAIKEAARSTFIDNCEEIREIIPWTITDYRENKGYEISNYFATPWGNPIMSQPKPRDDKGIVSAGFTIINNNA